MLKRIQNCDVGDFLGKDNEPTLWIIASSRERRSTEFARKLSQGTEVVFIHLDRPETPSIEKNFDDVLASNSACSNFKFTAFANEGLRDVELHSKLSTELNGRCLGIDISCMSRSMMASLVACAYRLAGEQKLVKVRLVYSIAQFKEPSQAMSNSAIGPVHSMFGGMVVNPNSARKCVVGLGYEKGKALGALEYLQLDASYLLVPDSPDKRYLEAVRAHNLELLEGKAKHVTYDVLNPHSSLIDVLSLITDLKKSNSIVLLPFGPKIFFFVCLLTSMEHPEAAIWDVSASDEKGSTNSDGEVNASQTLAFEFEIHHACGNQSGTQ